MSIFNTRTVLISIDERYPFFGFGKSKSSDTQIKVDVKTLKRWKETIAAFEAVQLEMEKAITPSPMLTEKKHSTE